MKFKTDLDFLKEIGAWLSFNVEPSKENVIELRKNLREHIAKASQIETVVREWVAVTDRLPKKMDNYRVFVSNKTLSYQRDAIYSKEHGGWVISDYGLGVLKDVTHWMELPSNPSA